MLCTSVVVVFVVVVIVLDPSIIGQVSNSWSAPSYKLIFCKVLIPMESIALDVLGKEDKPFLCKYIRASGSPFVYELHNYRKPFFFFFSIFGLYSYSRTKRVIFQEGNKLIIINLNGIMESMVN